MASFYEDAGEFLCNCGGGNCRQIHLPAWDQDLVKLALIILWKAQTEFPNWTPIEKRRNLRLLWSILYALHDLIDASPENAENKRREDKLDYLISKTNHLRHQCGVSTDDFFRLPQQSFQCPVTPPPAWRISRFELRAEFTRIVREQWPGDDQSVDDQSVAQPSVEEHSSEAIDEQQ